MRALTSIIAAQNTAHAGDKLVIRRENTARSTQHTAHSTESALECLTGLANYHLKLNTSTWAEAVATPGSSGSGNGSGSEREDNDTTQTRSKTNEEPDAASKTKSLLQQTNRRHACLSLRLSVCRSLARCVGRSDGRSLIVLSEQCSAAQRRTEQSRAKQSRPRA